MNVDEAIEAAKWQTVFPQSLRKGPTVFPQSPRKGPMKLFIHLKGGEVPLPENYCLAENVDAAMKWFAQLAAATKLAAGDQIQEFTTSTPWVGGVPGISYGPTYKIEADVAPLKAVRI